MKKIIHVNMHVIRKNKKKRDAKCREHYCVSFFYVASNNSS